MGRGYVVKNVEWRGYVVSKVGIELLGQLKMDMDILCWVGHLFRLNLFPSGSKNFRDVF